MGSEAAQTVFRPGLMSRKVLLCDWKGSIQYKLLLNSQTFKLNIQQQLG